MAAEPILVTGAAGFIGFHVARRLAASGRAVIGIDNLNAYYDPALKQARLAELARSDAFRFHKLDLNDRDAMAALFARTPVRPCGASRRPGRRAPFADGSARLHRSPTSPAFSTCWKAAGTRQSRISSMRLRPRSMAPTPQCRFARRENVDHPLSLYGATKKANELMAHAYAHLFGLPATGLRFFTVYGPWGRPDMAMWLFADAILAGRPIKLFNRGDMRRDFTYVDDIATAVVKLIDHPAQGNDAWSGDDPDPASSRAPWRIYNIGNHTPVDLMDVVRLLEQALGKTALKQLLPMQPGDVRATCADVDALQKAVGFAPEHAGRGRYSPVHRLVPRLSPRFKLSPLPSP